MNKRCLKLGVLLVSLLAFFGGVDVAKAKEVCDRNDANDWYFRSCKAYGEDGSIIVHVGKGHCDASCNRSGGFDDIVGNWEIITKELDKNGNVKNYNNLALCDWNAYVAPDDLSSNVAYTSMGTKKSASGCPAVVDISLDGTNTISLNWGSALNSEYKNDVNYEIYYGYNAKFYTDSKTQMQNKIKPIEKNVENIKELMGNNFSGVASLDALNFFTTDPVLNVSGLPSLYSSYNGNTVKTMSKEQLNKLYDDLNKDVAGYTDSSNNKVEGYKDIVSNFIKISPIIENVQINIESLLDWGKDHNLLEGEADTYNDVADYRYDYLVQKNTEAEEDYITLKVADSTFKNAMKNNIKPYYAYYKLLAGENGNLLASYTEKLGKNAEQMRTKLQIMYNLAIAAENRSFDAEFNIDKKFAVLAERISDLILQLGDLQDTFEVQATTIGLVDFRWGDGKVEVNCNNLLGNGMSETLNTIYFFIEIIVIIIVVVMSMLDFAKGVTSGDAEAMKKAWKNAVIRVVCVIVMVLLPVLINFVLNIFKIDGVDSDNPLCLEIEGKTGDN